MKKKHVVLAAATLSLALTIGAYKSYADAATKKNAKAATESTLTNTEGATQIAASGDSIVVTGDGAVAENGKVTIRKAGTYLLSGTLEEGQLLVDAEEGAEITLVFDGFKISNSTDAPLLFESGSSITLVLKDGSENAVTDLRSSAEENKAAIYTKSDLTISGNGTLDVTGTAEDAIYSKTNVTVLGGTINLKAGDDAIHADETLTILDGKVTVLESEEGLEGLVVDIQGGDITVNASDDGLNASDGSGSDKAPGQATEGAAIRISGGVLTVKAGGDGIDSNGNLIISGGTVVVDGPSDGGNAPIDYDGKGVISGGTVFVSGDSGMFQSLNDSGSTQNSIVYYLSETQAAGTKVVVADSKGNVIYENSGTTQAFNTVLFSATDLKSGENYTVTVGEQSETVSISDTVNNIGENRDGNGPQGGMNGGFERGERPERPGKGNENGENGGFERDERSERPGKGRENGENGGFERGNRPERPGKGSENGENSGFERGERPEHPGKGNENGENGGFEHGNRPERPSKDSESGENGSFQRGNRPERPENGGMNEAFGGQEENSNPSEKPERKRQTPPEGNRDETLAVPAEHTNTSLLLPENGTVGTSQNSERASAAEEGGETAAQGEAGKVQPAAGSESENAKSSDTTQDRLRGERSERKRPSGRMRNSGSEEDRDGELKNDLKESDSSQEGNGERRRPENGSRKGGKSGEQSGNRSERGERPERPENGSRKGGKSGEQSGNRSERPERPENGSRRGGKSGEQSGSKGERPERPENGSRRGGKSGEQSGNRSERGERPESGRRKGGKSGNRRAQSKRQRGQQGSRPQQGRGRGNDMNGGNGPQGFGGFGGNGPQGFGGFGGNGPQGFGGFGGNGPQGFGGFGENGPQGFGGNGPQGFEQNGGFEENNRPERPEDSGRKNENNKKQKRSDNKKEQKSNDKSNNGKQKNAKNGAQQSKAKQEESELSFLSPRMALMTGKATWTRAERTGYNRTYYRVEEGA